jgi:hypothetical protein
LKALAIAKKMVLNVKKLLNIGVGLVLKRKGGKKRCEQKERQI